jgi:hypothetical protein
MPVLSVGSMNAMFQHRGGEKFGTSLNSWSLVKLSIKNDIISMSTILQEVKIKGPGALRLAEMQFLW